MGPGDQKVKRPAANPAAPRRGGVKKNTLFIGTSQAIQLVLAFVLNWVAIRRLGAEDFGKYTFAWVLFYFVFLFNDFGIDTYLTREIAKNRRSPESLFMNSLMIKLAFIPVSALFLATYLSLFSFQRDKVIAVLLFGLVGLLYSFNQLCSSVYRAYERMEYEMAVTIIEKMLVTGLGVWVLLEGKGLVAFSCVFVIGGLVSLLINGIWVRNHFVRGTVSPDFPFMIRIVKAAFLFGLMGFLANIQERIGVLLLTAMKGDMVVGWFGATYRLILVFTTLPMILVTATFPRIANEAHHQKTVSDGIIPTLYTTGFKLLFFAALPLITGILFLGDKIVLMLFGSEFVESIVVLKILIFATGFEFINIFVAGFLMAVNLQKKLVVLQLSALAVNVLINLALIPRYAHIGASIATLVSYLLVLIVGLVWMHKHVCGLKEKRFFFQGSAASLVMLAFLCIGPRNVFLAVGSAAAVYGGVLFLLGGIRIQDLRLFRRTDAS
jgi:O-antigen/teichoic acid export membrane protein